MKESLQNKINILVKVKKTLVMIDLNVLHKFITVW